MTPEETREYNKKYREQNKAKISANGKEYYEQNKEKILANGKEYRGQNKEKISANGKEYYEQNKEKILANGKEYRGQNKEKISANGKEYRGQNKEKISANDKRYYEQNKVKIIAKDRNWKKFKMQEDPAFKFIQICRKRTWDYFNSKGIKKSKPTMEMLGCTAEELRDHLQSQFTEGMTLENHGEWHIDHIIPLSSAKTEEEIIKLCHYTNLQPLWAKDNLSKHAKILN
jgi:hypothetical protein